MATRKDFVTEYSELSQLFIALSGSYTSEFSACYWSKWLLAPNENWIWKFSGFEKHLEVLLDYKFNMSQPYDAAA